MYCARAKTADIGPCQAAGNGSPQGTPPFIAAVGRERYEQLAACCEASPGADHSLDADIYEMLGFEIRRKPAPIGRGTARPGGIFRQGEAWRAIAEITGDLGKTVEIVERLFPGAPWSVVHDPANAERCFHADVSGFPGRARQVAPALCAALLRAAASGAGERPRRAPAERAANALAQMRASSQ